MTISPFVLPTAQFCVKLLCGQQQHAQLIENCLIAYISSDGQKCEHLHQLQLLQWACVKYAVSAVLSAGTRNWEWYSVTYDGPKTDERSHEVWPSEQALPHFKQHALTFAQQCHEVAAQMVSALELALGVEEGSFTKVGLLC